ncbi:MAG TPA: LEA type 2 family protein [Gemmatimonadales bacterium]
MRHIMRHSPIAIAVLALSACASFPSTILDPDVQLHQVVLRGAGLTGGTMDLVVDVYNPNHFSLRGTRLQVGFDVDSAHVGDISYDEEFQVGSTDTTRIVLPLRFSWTGATAALRSALAYGDIPYTMRGQVTVATPAGDKVIPFTRQGRAPLTRGTSPASTGSGGLSDN